MKPADDEFVHQYTEAFNEQLRALAHHQNQALALIYAERIRQDLMPPKPPASLRQRLQDAYQQIRHQVSSIHQSNRETVETPTEEDVMVIDAEYTVLSSVTTQTIQPIKGKENHHGLFDTAGTGKTDRAGAGPADGQHGAGDASDPAGAGDH